MLPSAVAFGRAAAPEPALVSALGSLSGRLQPLAHHLLRASCRALHSCINGPNAALTYSAGDLGPSVPEQTGACSVQLEKGTALCADQLQHLRGEQSASGQSQNCGGTQQAQVCGSPVDHHRCTHAGECSPAPPREVLGVEQKKACRQREAISEFNFLKARHASSQWTSFSPAVRHLMGLGQHGSIGALDGIIGVGSSFGGGQSHRLASCFHTSSIQGATGAGSTGEASAKKATALEYKISADEAIHKFQEWSAGHWLGPISGVEDHTGRDSFSNIRAAYQPFWVFDAKVTSLFTGEIGFDYSTTTYNASTRRNESTSGTVWRQAPYTHSLRNDHPGDQPDMQVYASYTYRKAYMACLKGQELLRATQPLSAAMLAQGRELEPFTIKREIAWRRVKEKIQQQEVRKAEEFLRTTYHADQARNIQLQLQFEAVQAHAVYVPAYVLEYQHAGQFFRAVVNGATGKVGAERHLSALKVGGVVAAGLTAASLAGQYLGWGSLLGGVWGVAFLAGLSALAGYAAERWLPRVSAYVKELQHGRDVFEDSARAARARGAEEAGLDDDEDERERREHWQRQRAYQQWQGFGMGELNEQFERVMREFEEQFRRQGGGFGPFGVPPEWEQRHDRSGFDARRQGERQRQQQAAYEEQARRRQAAGGGRQGRQGVGYRTGDPLGYYAELSLPKGARSSEEEIKAAFRRLALEWHPDRHGQDPKGKAKAEEKFKKISQAYQVLRDPRRKANYDAGLAA